MEIKKPRGTEDWFGDRCKKIFVIETIIRQIVQKYNFSEIRTPIFESKELFVRSVGDDTDIVSKEMFEIIDKKDRALVLRPEATASTVRAILENKMYSNPELPLKQFYIGPMFRYERPQAGRLRQFHQFGVEVVGAKSHLLDVETILLANNIIQTFNLQDVTLKLNSLGGADTRKKYIKQLKVFLSGNNNNFMNLCEDCTTRIQKNPLRVLDCKVDYAKISEAPKIYEFLSAEEKTYFDSITKLFTKLDIKYVLDHQLVRGLDYYTDLVFEFSCKVEGNDLAILGGGRYDHLVNDLAPAVDLPAVGFAMGLERLLLILEKQQFEFGINNQIDAYIVCLSDSARNFAITLSLMLRNAGYTCEMDYLNRGLKAQFKSVDRTGARFAIIVGDEELKANKVNIKNQITKKEKMVTFDKIISHLEKEGK